MTVNLTRIYTKLGDGGETHLGDMSRVPKTHARVEAYGTVDELHAQLGILLTREDPPDGWPEWLRRVQNDLFDVGADVSVPAGGERDRLRLAAPPTEGVGEGGRARVRRVPAPQREGREARWAEVNAGLEPLRSFVLPGGTPVAAQLHVCRTVCRRAERRALAVGAAPHTAGV